MAAAPVDEIEVVSDSIRFEDDRKHDDDVIIDPPPPCDRCGGIMPWWTATGNQRCMQCDPPVVAQRLLKQVKVMHRPVHVCGESEHLDVTTSNGKVRRDCKVCGRFIEWIKW